MAYPYTFHMASTYLTLHLHLLFAFASLSGSTPPPKLALRLIHRHSIVPPSKLFEYDDIIAPVVPAEDGTIFLVNVSIGNPPIPQLMAMDTGSPMIWVHCTTCNGCKNIFNPQKSSTYKELAGDSPQCQNFVSARRELPNCPYKISYEDKSSSNGVLALEKFTFLTSFGGTLEIEDVVFGCAKETSGPIGDLNGIFGLEARNQYHLAARTGNKFSYCIGNLSPHTSYTFNQLVLGDGAVIQGDSTSMRIKDKHYYVTLEGISVGEIQYIVDPQEFYYNVIIDSGTTTTQLVSSAYEPLMLEVSNLIDGLLKRTGVRNAENQLCYKGNMERDLKGFPVVTLHLAEGVDVDLEVEALFQRSRDGTAFCMAVLESKENMIGVKAQQYYNVGFDLDANRVSFQRIDCELLEAD